MVLVCSGLRAGVTVDLNSRISFEFGLELGFPRRGLILPFRSQLGDKHRDTYVHQAIASGDVCAER